MKINKIMQPYLILVFLSGLFLFANCKKKQYKYPEDPKKTKLTPKERLNGNWQVREYTFNGNSIIQYLDTFYNGADRIEDVNMVYTQEPDSKKWILTMGSNIMSHRMEDAFEEPDQFRIFNDGFCCKFLLSKWFITPFRHVPNASATWTITKLYENDLNLILPTDSGEYKIFFKKTCCK